MDLPSYFARCCGVGLDCGLALRPRRLCRDAGARRLTAGYGECADFIAVAEDVECACAVDVELVGAASAGAQFQVNGGDACAKHAGGRGYGKSGDCVGCAFALAFEGGGAGAGGGDCAAAGELNGEADAPPVLNGYIGGVCGTAGFGFPI